MLFVLEQAKAFRLFLEDQEMETPFTRGMKEKLLLLESTVLVVLAVSATVIMFGNASSRYLFRTSFSWADELIRLIFVWSMFIAITTAFIRNQHISFSALAHLNDTTRVITDVLYDGILILVGAIVAYHGWRYMNLTGRVRLPGTELPTGLLLLPGVVSGAVWALLGGARIVTRLLSMPQMKRGKN